MSEVGAPGAGAPAPAPEPSAPLPEGGQARPPAPASSTPAARDGETSVGQPPSGKERRSISDSLDKAFEAAKTETKPEPKPKAETKPEPRPAPKPEAKAKPEPAQPPSRERGEGGRFVSSQNEPATQPEGGQQTSPEPGAPDHSQPPRNANFTREEMADWADTPDRIKAAVHRRTSEFENGLHKYRQAAEAYEPIRRWDEMARQSGTTLDKATENYVAIEAAVASDNIQHKLQGIERVLARGGLTPQQYASYILNQPQPTPDQKEAAHRQEITALRNELASIRRDVHGVASTQHEQQTKAIEREVTSFAQSQPRFEELSASDLEHSIQNLLKMPGMVPQGPPEQRLQKAYELADRLNPSANGRPAPLVPEPRPANGAGTKSIAGSPANGSDPSLPAKKGRHPTREESIDRAFGKLS